MARRPLTIACGVIVLCSLTAGAGSAQTVNAVPESAGQVARRAPAGQRRESAPPTLQRTVSVAFANTRLDAAIDQIAASAGVTILYTDRVLPAGRLVTDTLANVPLGAALARVLKGTGVVVRELKEGQLVLAKRETAAGSAAAHDTTNAVVGRVTSADTSRAALSGAVVQVKGVEVDGRPLTATTAGDGRYRLVNVPPGRQTLVARLVGYRPLERTLEVPDSGTIDVDFALEMSALRLQELVTTATGPQRRLEIANQVTVLRADSIVKTQPISDVTDLLQARVPGLAVLPTTGAPGDPARFRLRGSSSILSSNDPIVIVDGVRIYAEQSATRSGSLAWLDSKGRPDGSVPAPSPLNRIDLHSIERIDVLNGPSAATLYGADAANGVIVITTKRGRPGPAQWSFALTHDRSVMPGRFPGTYVGFGRASNFNVTDCSVLRSPRHPTCVVDSVISYQVLNDPELTVLGQGHRSGVSATVSGGRPDIRYAITGSYADELGMLKLPEYEAKRFREAFGRAPEDWMERPHRYETWSLASRFDFKPAPSADVTLTTSLAGVDQGRSTLEQQLEVLRGTYVDKTNGLIYRHGVGRPPTPSLVPDFYRRTNNRALAARTGVNVTWRPFARATVRADAGLSADVRRDESMLPRGLLLGTSDSLGFLVSGQGNVTMGTLNLGASYDVPLGWGFKLDAAAGFNYTSQSVADLVRTVPDPTGAPSTAKEHQSSQSDSDFTTYGWYVAPRINHKRFFLDFGLRLDGGGAGTAVSSPLQGGLLKLPKLGGSWLISDEPFFPLRHSRLLTALRLRAAYGKAGVQPGVAEQFRTYRRATATLDGRTVEFGRLNTLGNTELRPERSTEIEWGFDADLFDSRLSVGLSGYRKIKNDAISPVIVPPSLGSHDSVLVNSVLVNIGVIRNTGFELTLWANLLPAVAPVQWSTNLIVSHNRNVVVSLANGLEAFGLNDVCGLGRQCVVVGYPLFGYWERPILGYVDANGSGVLEASEILVSDSAAYLGVSEPDYTAALHTSVGLFRGALSVSASLDYQGGFAQYNQGALASGALARAKEDPSAPFAHQAIVVAAKPHPSDGNINGTRYGLIQTVSALRFHSLSVNWQFPTAVARWIGAQQGSLAVQGKNLGLFTNYRGKDPLVNSIATGNAVMDRGALPPPREWRVALNLSY